MFIPFMLVLAACTAVTDAGDSSTATRMGTVPTLHDTSTRSAYATGELFVVDAGTIIDIAIADNYLYFAPGMHVTYGILCRVPLAGGKPEVVYVSKYWNPDVPVPTDCTADTRSGSAAGISSVVQSDDWLVMLDSELPYVYTPHAIVAYYMPSGAIRVIKEFNGFDASSFSVYDDLLAIGTLQHLEGDKECQDQSVIEMVNLSTDDADEIYRSCVNDGAFYNPLSGIALSENWLVLTRGFPDSLGSASEIVLWNRATNEQTLLSGDEYAYFPAIGSDWVTWKVASPGHDRGLGEPQQAVLHQISTGKQWRLSPAYGTDEPYIDDGRWLYWQKLANPEPWQTVFDLESGKMYRFVTDTENYKLYAWRIHGNTIAWSLDEQLMVAGDPDGMLRWRTGADPLTLMTVDAPPIPDWWNPNDPHTYTSYGLTDIDLSQ